MKLLKMFPQLSTIVQALFIGLGSIRHVGLLVLLTYYVFGVIAFYLFGKNDPENFGNLHTAILTLSDVATLDNWGTIM